jgi:alpha-ribazole phosphatase
MKLYLIRHPKPEHADGVCYGRLDLSVDSAESARTLVEVRERIPPEIWQQAPIVTSPLARCANFANALAAPGTAQVADELIEMDFGTWEGRPWQAISREELDRWSLDLWTYRPGDGENAVSIAARWERWLARMRATKTTTVVAVTHAGVIRVALALAGRRRLDDLAQATIAFGSVHCIADADTAGPGSPWC